MIPGVSALPMFPDRLQGISNTPLVEPISPCFTIRSHAPTRFADASNGTSRMTTPEGPISADARNLVSRRRSFCESILGKIEKRGDGFLCDARGEIKPKSKECEYLLALPLLMITETGSSLTQRNKIPPLKRATTESIFEPSIILPPSWRRGSRGRGSVGGRCLVRRRGCGRRDA